MGIPQKQRSRLVSPSYPPLFIVPLLALALVCALSACSPSAPSVQAQAAVYAAGVSGSGAGLNALRASDGALLWQTPIPQDSESAVVSVTATPSRVYVVSGGKPSSTDWSLLALRASDGKVAWSLPSGGMIAGMQVSGDTVYVGTQSGLRALRASDGRVLWQREGVVTALALAGDTLYVAFAGAVGPGSVAALHASDGAERWHAQIDAPAWQMLVDQATLYVTTASGVLALQMSDGAQLWRSRNADVLLVGVGDQNVYLTQIQGQAVILMSLDAVTGYVLWQRTLLSNWYGAPIITKTLIYAKLSITGLCALLSRDGGASWCYGGKQPIVLAANDQTAYVSDVTGVLCALQATDGSHRWCQQHFPASSLVVAVDRLLLTIPGGTVCALQTASGKQDWCRHVADSVFDLTSSP